MNRKLEDSKSKIRVRLAAVLDEKRNRKLASPPNYDAEFFEGLQWLDSLVDVEEY